MAEKYLLKTWCGRVQARWRQAFPEKRPERLLHDKPWSEMSLWEKRMFGGKDGKPIPIKSMAPKPISHQECEAMLDQALKRTLWERVRDSF